MRRFAVAGLLVSLLSLIGAGSAMAATTTVTGTYAGTTSVSGGCFDVGPFVWNGTQCDFDGTGYMTGTTGTGDPWVAGYQAHLDVDPQRWLHARHGRRLVRARMGGPAGRRAGGRRLVAILGPGSQICFNGFSIFTPSTIHLVGTVSGMGIGPWQDASGTFTRDGTITPVVDHGVDNGTFSVTYTVPDPPPPRGHVGRPVQEERLADLRDLQEPG